MEIQTTTGAGFTTLAVTGRLDARTAPAADSALQGAIEAGASRLVVNLAGLEYVSSAGLRVLLLTAKKLSRQNGKLVLCGMQPGVREVFAISGMLSVFPNAADEAAAQALAMG